MERTSHLLVPGCPGACRQQDPQSPPSAAPAPVSVFWPHTYTQVIASGPWLQRKPLVTGIYTCSTALSLPLSLSVPTASGSSALPTKDLLLPRLPQLSKWNFRFPGSSSPAPNPANPSANPVLSSCKTHRDGGLLPTLPGCQAARQPLQGPPQPILSTATRGRMLEYKPGQSLSPGALKGFPKSFP